MDAEAREEAGICDHRTSGLDSDSSTPGAEVAISSVLISPSEIDSDEEPGPGDGSLWNPSWGPGVRSDA